MRVVPYRLNNSGQNKLIKIFFRPEIMEDGTPCNFTIFLTNKSATIEVGNICFKKMKWDTCKVDRPAREEYLPFGFREAFHKVHGYIILGSYGIGRGRNNSARECLVFVVLAHNAFGHKILNGLLNPLPIHISCQPLGLKFLVCPKWGCHCSPSTMSQLFLV